MIPAFVLLVALYSGPARPSAPLAARVDEIIAANAERRGIDSLLVRTVIQHESAGNPRAAARYDERGRPCRRVRGPAAASAVAPTASAAAPTTCGPPKDFGLMQLRIGAATRGLKLTRAQLFDPEINVYFGAWYLADKLAECSSLARALGAYSSGKCRVNDYARTVVREYRRAQQAERDAWKLGASS